MSGALPRAGFYAKATVHGRFQPPHLDHLDYITMSLQFCDHLIIGITQFDVRALKVTSLKHRSEHASNPLTYYERQEAITRMLVAEGVDKERFSFAPFPIEEPAKLADFIGPRVPCFTTLMEPWNAEKVARLKRNGFPVTVLDHRTKKRHEGSEIREHIRAGNDVWKDSCHPAVVAYLEELGFIGRIRHS